MPQTWRELADQLLELQPGMVESLEGKSCEELRHAIAGYYFDPEKHLPQLSPMCGYDATMEFSERGNDFWEDYKRGWVAEPKIDEIRMLIFFYKGQIRLQSRGRHKNTQLYHETTQNFPQFQKLYHGELEGTILDGGMVAGLGNRTRNLWKDNDLLKMMSITGSKAETAIGIQREEGWARYIIFDIIKYKNIWVTKMWENDEFYRGDAWPLETRRSMTLALAERFRNFGIDALPQWRRDIRDKYNYVVKTGGEGIMLKRSGSLYKFKRDMDWRKVKRYEDVVCFVHSKKRDGNRAWEGLVGSLNVADADGNIIGSVGTMTLERRKELSMPDGTLNPAYVGRKILMRFYKKHADTGNPRHARLIGWIGEDINEEETIKEEV